MPGWISSLWYAGHLLATGQLDNTLPGPRKHNISLTGLIAFALLQVGAFLPWAAVCLLPVAIIVHSSASVRLIIKRANLLIERQGPLVLEFYMPPTGQLDNTLPGPRKHNISLTGLIAFALLQVGAFLPWAAVCLLPVAIIVHSSASVRLIIKRANLLIERQGPLVLEFYMPRWHPPVGDCMHHSRDTV